MSDGIIIAIIGVIGSIVAAIITGIFGLLKRNPRTTGGTNIIQKGRCNTQIGIQNNYGKEK